MEATRIEPELHTFLIRNKGILLNLLEKALIAESTHTSVTMTSESERSRSRSRSRRRSNSAGSSPDRPKKYRRSRSESRSPSSSPSRDRKHKKSHKKSSRRHSRSRSRNRSRRCESPAVYIGGHKVHPTPPTTIGRTYSPLPRRGSAAPPPPPGYGRRYRSDTAPFAKNKRDGREKPDPCRCLGIFGMSLHTREKDLEQIFGEFGSVEQVQIVRDRISGRSRGFGFVYFGSTKHAAKAKEEMTDAVIDGMKVRVDFSVTNKPSTGFSGRERDGSRQRTSPVY